MLRSLKADNLTKEEAISELPEWLRSHKVVEETGVLFYNWSLVGSLIRSRREKIAGASLRKVAETLGVTAVYLSDLERGNRPWPKERLEHITVILESLERESNE